MPLTSEQINFRDAVLNSDQNIAGLARAGTGKTFTIVETVRALSGRPLRILVCSFNVLIRDSMVKALKAHGVDNVEVKTLNSVGYAIYRKNRKGFISTKHYRTFAICNALGIAHNLRKPLARIIGLAKALGAIDGWREIAAHYGVYVPVALTDDLVLTVWKESLNAGRLIDFNDQIFLPVYHNMEAVKYDVVFVDEAQDLNPVQMDLIAKIAKRVVLVGDDLQAIYGFRGAGVNAFHTMVERFNCVTFPLTTCFRCSKAVVQSAQRFAPDIRASESAVVGDVSVVRNTDGATSDDIILCRTNAPLVESALKYINNGVPVSIKGRAILEDLFNLLDELPATLTHEAIERLRDSKFTTPELTDLFDILNVFQAYTCVGLLIRQKASALFADSAVGILHSTIHRAKGIGARDVYLLRPDLLPHPKASKVWELAQESNLHYVALTRTKRNFNYVHSA